MALLPPLRAESAPYAAMVIDARSGEVLHSRNADTRLHPASLTKMMTLYVTFEAIRNGEISLETRVKISRKAANEPPSKLGLKAGQTIRLRYLIRAASVKSANDAATALAEAVGGSEAAFARRMNRTAAALGMSRTSFKNAHGLTETGHMSTARDMTTMGRHLFYDYPEYYNLFSRISTDAGLRQVANTNRRFLGSYKGADGIKTGYTRAAGFNLVASAERGRERIITTVFGGASTASRNAKVAELMDMGFRRAPSRARVSKPALPVYADGNGDGGTSKPPAGKTIRLVRTITKSIRPVLRPSIKPTQAVLVAMATDIQNALQAAQEPTVTKPEPNQVAKAPTSLAKPVARPQQLAVASASPKVLPDSQQPEIVTRISTSGGRHWGINVGRYGSRFEAEGVLLRTALKELGTLDDALRKVVQNSRGYEANFVGMTQEMAALACRRLSARNVECTTLGPS
ncbi:MAG: D-alanyl-D-alanine carboxypeptidase [Marinosulfonomonas sp.]|nr:D-alanyl-D-alanine carboxypeptidase [Marinosulfonomonas sp.]